MCKDIFEPAEKCFLQHLEIETRREKKRIGDKNSKAVDQLTLDGQYIKTFKSVKAASEACGLSSGAISNAIRKETTSGGFRWQHHK